MRDDIQSIIDETSLAVERKIAYFSRFLEKEHELNSFLKTDFENEPLLIIETENNIIGEINIQDFIIACQNDEFRKKSGKNLSSCELANYADINEKLSELSSLRRREKSIIAEISALRRENNHLMEKIKKDIDADADELKRIMELENIITKDSQSFF